MAVNTKEGIDFKELRKAAKVSQEEVALTVGVDQSHISKIELGKIEPFEGLRKRLLDYYKNQRS